MTKRSETSGGRRRLVKFYIASFIFVTGPLVIATLLAIRDAELPGAS